MNLVLKNIVSNYIGKVWSFVAIYLFIPQYVKLLGIESYGIINFYTVLLAIMLVADTGLSASLNREMARSDDLVYKRNLLRTIERVYIVISLIIFFGIFLLSENIVNGWLNVGGVFEKSKLYTCVKIMGASIALQMMFIMYTSGLMGLQKQVLANNIQILVSIFRSGFVLLPLYYFRDIQVYFIWQLLTMFTFTIVIRFKLWRVLKYDIEAIFSSKILKDIYGFAFGMLLMAIISGLNTQIDKIFVSKLLPIKDFGYYSLAGVIGQTATILVLPIAVAILPKMTRFAEDNNSGEQQINYHKFSFIIATIVAIVTGVLLVFTDNYLLLWIKDNETVMAISSISKILLLGGAFLALQYMPYHLAIANGHTSTNVKLGGFILICVIPLLYFLINIFGLRGATYSWLLINVFAFMYLGYFLTNKFLPNQYSNWILKNTCLPIFISIIIFYSFVLLFPLYYTWDLGINIFLSIMLAGTVLVINAIIFYKIYIHNK